MHAAFLVHRLSQILACGLLSLYLSKSSRNGQSSSGFPGLGSVHFLLTCLFSRSLHLLPSAPVGNLKEQEGFNTLEQEFER